MKKFIERYPIITFGIISILFLPIIGLANLELFPSSFNYALMFPQWTPTLAAIIVLVLSAERMKIRNLFQRTLYKSVNLKWLLLAAIIPIICCGASYAILMFVQYGEFVPPVFTRSIGNYIICLLATIFGCYGEEIGWRGFMLPQLNEKHSLFVSSLIVGLFWGVWHMRFQIGLLAFGLFIIGVVFYSFLISWICTKTKANILAAIVFHTAINMSSLVLFENLLSDITQQQTDAGIASPNLYVMLYGIYATVFAIPALFVIKNMIGKKTIGQIK